MKEKFRNVIEKKKSQLCVGLDPNPKKVTPKIDSIYEFCVDVINKTSDNCFCFKPNTQYVTLPLGLKKTKELNEYIHKKGCLSIADHKLSDIGSTNKAAVFWLSSMGFDAFTYSPFPGNIEETIKNAKEMGLGVITLTLMSNPEADYFMKSTIQNETGYKFIAEQIVKHDGFGAVIGATCKLEDIKELAQILKDQFILAPGVGAQGGGLDIVRLFRERTIVNVSRDIIFNENPAERSLHYKELINSTK